MARNQNKLNKLLKYLKPDPTSADFAELDKQISLLKEGLKEKITVKTIDDVNATLDKFKKRLSLQPILDAVENIKKSFEEKSESLFDEIEEKTNELSKADKERVDVIKVDLFELQAQVSSLEERRKVDLERIFNSIPNLAEFENIVNEMMLEVSSRVDELEKEEVAEEKELEDWQKKIDELRRDLMDKMSNVGGGSQNRQITVGNTDVLKYFTDINLKAGSNMTITAATNQATKRTDITFSSSGGGGGSTRSIQSISASQTADSASGTDYVYLCSGTMTLTMPTAVGNTNLYTVKNVGTGIVTINCTGSEKIDNDVNVIMPVRYTAVDLISDTLNWNIT